MESKQEFLDRMAAQYDKQMIGNNWAKSMSENIKHMREKGYNIIVMGDNVKVTLKKEKS